MRPDPETAHDSSSDGGGARRRRAAVSAPLAVILAAGVGRRLAPLTGERPKALVEVAGVSLLERSLGALEAGGFRDVLVVTGHHADRIERFVRASRRDIRVSCRLNPDYQTANNIVSFLSVADAVREGFCLLNSDIVFDGTILRDVTAADDGSWLVMDADEPLGDEEMKIKLRRGGTVERVSKRLPPEKCAGEYIGIARFDARGAAEMVTAARTLVAEGRTDLYYEDAIDAAARDLPIRTIPTRGRKWTEIDDMADYERAVAIAHELDGSVRA
jgi:choline kinase